MSAPVDLQKIKDVIENNICPEHNEKPIMEINGSKFNIKTCCDPFKSEISEMSKTMLVNQTKEYLTNQITEIFK